MTIDQVSGRGWRDAAACRGTDPEVFFPTAEDVPSYEAQVAVAKRVCASCPVRSECLTEALVRIPDGVAGGMTPEERRDLTPARRPAVAAGERALLVADRREAAEDALALLAAGRSARVVAQWCGVTERTVTRWAARAHDRAGVPA